MVIAEALARGLPVLATAVGEVPKFVRNEESGYLIPNNDVATIRSALIRYTTTTDEDYEIMSDIAHGIGKKELGRDRMVTAYEAVYKRVLRIK